MACARVSRSTLPTDIALRIIGLSAAAMALGAGCQDPGPGPDPGAPCPPNVNFRSIVFAWMECDECANYELDTLVNMPEPCIREAMDLLTGTPPDDRQQAYEDHLAQTYQRLVAYRASHPGGPALPSEATYTRIYLDGYVERYRIRTEIALDKLKSRQDLTPSMNDAIEDAFDHLFHVQ